MRKFYKSRRNRVLNAIECCPLADKLSIQEENAGLHFLVKVDTSYTDQALTDRLAQAGIRIYPLSSYYHGPVPEESRRCLIVNYSGLTDEQLAQLEEKLRGFV